MPEVAERGLRAAEPTPPLNQKSFILFQVSRCCRSHRWHSPGCLAIPSLALLVETSRERQLAVQQPSLAPQMTFAGHPRLTPIDGRFLSRLVHCGQRRRPRRRGQGVQRQIAWHRPFRSNDAYSGSSCRCRHRVFLPPPVSPSPSSYFWSAPPLPTRLTSLAVWSAVVSSKSLLLP